MNRQLQRQLVSAAVLGRTRQTMPPGASSVASAPPFLGGVVVRVQGTTMLAATRDGDVALECRYARVWKGGGVTVAACQPGDFFYARGQVSAGAVLMVSHLWLNIVNIVGLVERVAGDTLHVRHTHMGVRVLDRVSRVVIDRSTERFRRSTDRPLDRGGYVQVVGVQVSSELIRATRMWG